MLSYTYASSELNLICRIMAKQWPTFTIILVTVVLFSIMAFVVAAPDAPCPAQNQVSDPLKQVVELLNGILDLDITICTGVVGLSAALLLGIQGDIKLKKASLTLLSISIILLVQSILYAIIWRLGLANLWFNDAVSCIAKDPQQTSYKAHFLAMGLGIFFFAVTVVVVAFERANSSSDGENAQ
ncbi:hypothetical protein NKI96_14910 [Mesorhizobium sp. M0292]|uniref:hypothetical protein n=1 Tax=Mesorhizobium sp. M0292 TaxID=2956929 RepID=UPI00333B1B25